jgi:Flp pilus assembly protein TadD
MQRERQTRADVYTYDALAWCLYKKGRSVEAREAIDQARRLGTQDARIFYHSGMIYDALGDRAQAIKYLQLAIKTDSAFDVLQVEVARQKLRELGKQEHS